MSEDNPATNHWLSLNPKSTALIVIDMQVDFCSPSGSAAKRGKKLSAIQNILPQLEAFSHQLADMGVTVVFTKFLSGMNITPENLHQAVIMKGHTIPCVKGSGGEELYQINVLPQEKIKKNHTTMLLPSQT